METALHLDPFQSSFANVFPVDCELCFFFFLVVLFGRLEVSSVDGAAVKGAAPTFNALDYSFNGLKTTYSPDYNKVPDQNHTKHVMLHKNILLRSLQLETKASNCEHRKT